MDTYYPFSIAGIVSACWAALVYHGKRGYVDYTRSIIQTTRKIEEGLEIYYSKAVIDIKHMKHRCQEIINYQIKYHCWYYEDLVWSKWSSSNGLTWYEIGTQFLSLFTFCLSTSRCRKIKGVFVYGKPEVSVVALGSNDYNIYQLSDRMGKRGWNLNALQYPPRWVFH